MADSLFYHSILSCSQSLHSTAGPEEQGQLTCSPVDLLGLYLCGEGFGLSYADVKLKPLQELIYSMWFGE